MSQPYYSYPGYSPAEANAGSYLPDQHQAPRYNNDAYHAHQEHIPAGEYAHPYSQPEYAHSNISQSHLQPPVVYHPQNPEPPSGYVGSESTGTRTNPYSDGYGHGHDENRLTPYYVPSNRGSSAEY
ncbi:hypothetical protein BDV18DRAFT_132106 [Aspergillus unguis]